MPRFRRDLFKGLAIAGLSACGSEVNETARVLATHNTSPKAVTREGKDETGEPCRWVTESSASGALEKITLSGSFRVDYKIPTPGSGLYGVNRWPGSLVSEDHSQDRPLVVRPSWFKRADRISFRGRPLFWNEGIHDHEIELSPSQAAPQSLRYHAAEKLGGILPWVTIDLVCTSTEGEPAVTP